MHLPRDAWLASLPKRHVAAALLITADDDHVLLVLPTYRETWNLPGGVAEAGESPSQACAREVREELALDLPVGRLLCVEHIRGQTGREHLEDGTHYVYDGGTLPAGVVVTLPADELRDWRAFPVVALDEVMTPRLACRVRAALRARKSGTVVELADGRERPSGTDG